MMTNRFSILVTFILSFMISTAGFAQAQADMDPLLNARFSKAEFDQLPDNERAYWDFVVNNGFEIFSITKEKSQSEMSTIEYEGNLEDFNPLLFGISPAETHVQSFRIGQSSNGVMVLSRQKILAKMNRLK